MLTLTILVVLAALVFDFVNGFHDASNSIATIVATRVLRPWQAVIWAAFFNFVALFFFGTEVAKTVGSGMVALDTVTPMVILAGLIGAVMWGLTTWWFGLPTSSSHALLGGYAGAAMISSAMRNGWSSFHDPIIIAGWSKTLLFIVLAPLAGLAIAHVLMRAVSVAQKRFPKEQSEKTFGYLQLCSSAFLSLMHGSNDAQKTAGIIAGALVAGGFHEQFVIPYWVLLASYGVMGLGTLFGGWRIVNTMGRRLTRLRPNGGFSAESSAALSILTATLLGMPVSTTQVTTGAILGVGTARRLRAVRWGVAGRIVWAWVLTIPASAAMASLVVAAAHLCGF
ncbi:MAG: inorganic phosphate transporter [Alphaproteobacteria bacterium]|nr:inorganic phosphate transporter [Alphaproteobacteria bacterium]